MNIQKIWAISFSPTGTSKRVINGIASGIHNAPVEQIELTYSDRLLDLPEKFAPTDLVILGVPVYAGRVANLAVERMKTLVGTDTPAVIVVTYGNREFEDALIELKDIVENAAFKPIAAGAFIGEHSFSNIETPIAANRPDTADLATAKSFGTTISEKLNATTRQDQIHCPEVPGNRPYKEGMGQLPFTPTIVVSNCTACESCLSACPTGAISLEKEIEIDPNRCIFCCACIKTCLENALILDAEPLKQKQQWLFETCQKRKEPELFL